ncbi:MAG TPA: Asp-tRNA(Asn)/Glu-tRNA(Gln) amidotransferase subunit GatC [Verrucomicrobiae bacterium]
MSADFDIHYVANLARIALTPEEEAKLGSQLGGVLQYIEKLGELDVSNVEPTAHSFPLVNVVRPDEVRPSLPHDDAMKNAPSKGGGLFLVPKIVE